MRVVITGDEDYPVLMVHHAKPKDDYEVYDLPAELVKMYDDACQARLSAERAVLRWLVNQGTLSPYLERLFALGADTIFPPDEEAGPSDTRLP